MTDPVRPSFPHLKPNSRRDTPGIDRTDRLIGVVGLCDAPVVEPDALRRHVIQMSDWQKICVAKSIAPAESIPQTAKKHPGEDLLAKKAKTTNAMHTGYGFNDLTVGMLKEAAYDQMMSA